jgi:hypothetical protein
MMLGNEINNASEKQLKDVLFFGLDDSLFINLSNRFL